MREFSICVDKVETNAKSIEELKKILDGIKEDIFSVRKNLVLNDASADLLKKK